MPAVASVDAQGPVLALRGRSVWAASQLGAWARESVSPNALVRWAFYLAAFVIPFTRLYLPGTGERLGVIRVVQFLLICAVASQPRLCLRLVPVAVLWFAAYCGVRLAWGLWLAPELRATWWPSTLEWLEYALPWVWVSFNLLQWPRIARRGLWALVWGCAFCALLHLLGIGVTTVDDSIEEVRTTVFGENANVVGANYAAALIVLVGMGMFKDLRASSRWLLFPLIGVIGIAMAKTGSRTALLLVAIGSMTLLFQAGAFLPRARRYVTLVLIGGVLAGAVWQVPTVVERFHEINPRDIGQRNPRARMAPVLWEIFLRSPLYGSGPDEYRFEVTRRAMPYFFRDQQLIAAHNLVLLLLVETGVIGFAVFGAGVWKTLVAAWRARLKPCGLLPLALILPFVLAGIVVSNPMSDHVFWFAVAYALAGVA